MWTYINTDGVTAMLFKDLELLAYIIIVLFINAYTCVHASFKMAPSCRQKLADPLPHCNASFRMAPSCRQKHVDPLPHCNCNIIYHANENWVIYTSMHYLNFILHTMFFSSACPNPLSLCTLELANSLQNRISKWRMTRFFFGPSLCQYWVHISHKNLTSNRV